MKQSIIVELLMFSEIALVVASYLVDKIENSMASSFLSLFLTGGVYVLCKVKVFLRQYKKTSEISLLGLY